MLAFPRARPQARPRPFSIPPCPSCTLSGLPAHTRHPRRRHRLRRWTWRCLLVLSLLTAALWTGSRLSRAWSFNLPLRIRSYPSAIHANGTWNHDYLHATIADGALALSSQTVWTPQSKGPPEFGVVNSLRLSTYNDYRNNRRSRWALLLGPTNFGQFLTIPIAPVSVTLLIAGWLIYRRDRRLSRIGFCLSCGYDTRPLPDPTPCPECGRHQRIMP